jgi:hypothetical protein
MYGDLVHKVCPSCLPGIDHEDGRVRIGQVRATRASRLPGRAARSRNRAARRHSRSAWRCPCSPGRCAPVGQPGHRQGRRPRRPASRWPRRPTRSGWPPPRRPPRRRPPSSPPRCAAHPAIALSAYRNAEAIMARAQPGCGISWNLLAASAGSNRATPTTAPPTRAAPRSAPSTARPGRHPAGQRGHRLGQPARPVTYARDWTMQFLPGTWSRFASDGDGDGKADPQNVYDATLRRPVPVQRRAESARPVAGADGDPALQQLDGLRPQRARMGRLYATGVRRSTCRPSPVPRRHRGRAAGRPHGVQRGLGPGLSATDPLPVFSLTQSRVANSLPVPPDPPRAPRQRR